MIDDNKLYTSKEVCKLLNISVRTLRNYTSKNLLQYSKTKSNRILILGKDLSDFLNRGNENKA